MVKPEVEATRRSGRVRNPGIKAMSDKKVGEIATEEALMEDALLLVGLFQN
jgi:hypothetical protein